MRTNGMYINGIGVFLPPTVSVKQAVAEGRYPVGEAESSGLTGVAVAGDIPAPEMGLRAARAAFERCGRDPAQTGLLLYADSWHQGPDGWHPQYYLQRHLVGGNALAAEIRQGCNGVFCALELAAPYLRWGASDGCALIVAADNMGTPLVDRWRVGPGFIAADGASALVLTTSPGFAEVRAVRSVTMPELEELHRMGEPLFPPGATLGSQMDLVARVTAFKEVARKRADVLDAWLNVYRRMLEIVAPTLDEAGVKLADVRRIAFPNSGRDVVEKRWMASLERPLADSTWEYGRGIGHVGSSDQVIALDHLIATGELEPGDDMLWMGVGPGLTLSTAVVRILEPPPRT